MRVLEFGAMPSASIALLLLWLELGVSVCAHAAAISGGGSLMGRVKRQPAWFDRLPNESMIGVPKIILQYEKYYPRYKDFTLSLLGRSGASQQNVARARKLHKAQEIIQPSVKFPCDLNNSRSAERPSSVHKLRPGDIDVIAAMGDSLTAGNGGLAITTQQVMVENRGISGTIGGQGTWREFVTLPNIMKEFNPKLFGYSLSDSFTHHPESQFNIAEIGAMSQDIPFMTRQLVKRIKKDPRVDFENDWKLVTLLIGSNNFCIDLCYLSDAFTSVEGHRQDLIKSFEYLRDRMPRTIVNLMMTPHLKLLVDLKGLPGSCELMHVFECPCLFALQHQKRKKEFYGVMTQWQKVEEEVANDERFRAKDDFAVVVQPFTRNLTFPKKVNARGETVHDLSYLSEDCFHFSQKGYHRASTALWNNMLQPIGAKANDWSSSFTQFLCPTDEHPYIYTWKNSIS